MSRLRSFGLVVPIAFLAAAAVAVGSSGCASKPAFCSDLDSLEQSVRDLVQVETINSSTLNEVETDFERVEQDASVAVESAREDFPEETQELEDRVSATAKAFENLPASPAAGDYIALGLQVVSLGKAASDFESKASSSCN